MRRRRGSSKMMQCHTFRSKLATCCWTERGRRAPRHIRRTAEQAFALHRISDVPSGLKPMYLQTIS